MTASHRIARRRLRSYAGLLVASCAAIAAVQAQPAEPAAGQAAVPVRVPVPVPRTTGDATLDLRLLDIDRYGARYRPAFIDELVRYHAAPRDLVLDLLERGWSPGDVYYACALAYTTGRACRLVVDSVPDGVTPDWIAIADRLDASPGSPRHQRLHERIEATYRRWGRPLPPVAAATAAAAAAVQAATTAPAGARNPVTPPAPREARNGAPRRKQAGGD